MKKKGKGTINVIFKVFKRITNSKGLTQQELAESLNISLPNIKTIEAG